MRVNWLWVGVAVAALVALGTGGAVMYGQTLGLRSNNPGNIRAVKGVTWQGQIGVNEKGFVIFDTMENGLRALATVLKNYASKHGLNTVRAIITRYAPSNENKTDAYVADVAKRVGVTPDAVLNVNARMADLMRAIIRHENGINPLPDSMIAQSITAAGITTAYA